MKKRHYLLVFCMLCVLSGRGSSREILQRVDLPENDLFRGNVHSPQVSPTGRFLVCERITEDIGEVLVMDRQTRSVRKVSAVEDNTKKTGQKLIGDDLDDFFDSSMESISCYEGDASFRPVLDQNGHQWIVFISSGTGKEFDLYLADLDVPGSKAIRLNHEGIDRFPAWSPDGQTLAFVSKGMGASDIFFTDKIIQIINSGNGSRYNPEPLTRDGSLDLYPVWSPDGTAIAYQSDSEQAGLKNTTINVLALQNDGRFSAPFVVTEELGGYNEYKPSWSPDGNYLAFYKTRFSIGTNEDAQVMDVNLAQIVRDRRTGQVVSAQPVRGKIGSPVGRDVKPFTRFGPAWTLWNKELIYTNFGLLYTLKDEVSERPIEAVELKDFVDRGINYTYIISTTLQTKNHDDLSVTVCPDGLYAVFVSHEEVMPSVKLTRMTRALGFNLMQDTKKSTAVMKSLIPGMGQRYKGENGKGTLFMSLTGLSLGAAAYYYVSYSGAAADVDDKYEAYIALNRKMNQSSDDYFADQAELVKKHEEWEQSYQEFEDHQGRTMCMAFCACAGAIYIYNLIDAGQGFPLLRETQVSGTAFSVDGPVPVLCMKNGNTQMGISIGIHF